MKKIIFTSKLAKAIGPYSQGIMQDKFVFTSGQIYLTKEGKLLEGTIEEQTHKTMKNLKAIIEAGGATFNDVVKTTIYVTDLSLYARINEVYASYFVETFPARETVAVKELPMGRNVNYLTKEEEWTDKMLDAWRRADKQDLHSLQRHLGPLLTGFDFMERNERANEFVEWGARLIKEGNLNGNELIRLGSTIRPIDPAPGCLCTGG